MHCFAFVLLSSTAIRQPFAMSPIFLLDFCRIVILLNLHNGIVRTTYTQMDIFEC
jgi:hypothetical protein